MNADRRDFLKKLAGAAGVACVMGPRAARAASSDGSKNDWMGLLTDLSLCVGCRKCEWACKDANDLPGQLPIEAYEDTTVFDQRRRTDPANYTVVNRYSPAKEGGPPVDVKTQCMHCIEPACASACLVAAFHKTPEGSVVYNEDVCIGCRYCMVACPFSIPTYTYDDAFTPAVQKCTMCYDRIRQEGGLPACAKICPKEAITFGKRRDLIDLAHERIRHAPDKYVNHVYGEHEAGGTCWMYLAPKPFEELGFRTDLGSTPYPELTKGFLSSVPLVLVIWPALLMGAHAFTKHREALAKAQSSPQDGGRS